MGSDRIEVVNGVRYLDGEMVDTECSDLDVLTDDASLYMLGEEVRDLDRDHPGVASVRDLFRDAIATWLKDVPREDRKRRFLQWLATRHRDGAFTAGMKRRRGQRVSRRRHGLTR
jgi:hypothetical protein